MYGLLSVDEDVLVVFGVVCWACGDAQHVLLVLGEFRHLDDLDRDIWDDLASCG